MASLLSYRPDFQEILEGFFEAVYSGTPFPFNPQGTYQDIRRIPQVYQHTGGQFWLLFEAEALIGTVAVRALEPGVAELKRLQVLQDYQGRGYGKLLIQQVMEHAAELEFSRLRLDSIRDKAAALHLYKRFGFQEIERYNDNPHADIFMEYDLRRLQ